MILLDTVFGVYRAKKLNQKVYSDRRFLGKPFRPEASSLFVERLPTLVIHAVEYLRPVKPSFLSLHSQGR